MGWSHFGRSEKSQCGRRDKNGKPKLRDSVWQASFQTGQGEGRGRLPASKPLPRDTLSGNLFQAIVFSPSLSLPPSLFSFFSFSFCLSFPLPLRPPPLLPFPSISPSNHSWNQYHWISVLACPSHSPLWKLRATFSRGPWESLLKTIFEEPRRVGIAVCEADTSRDSL